MPGRTKVHSFSKLEPVVIRDAEPADFERAVCASGYGKFNIILYCISTAAGWSSVFETTAMSYVFPAAECDLQLTLNHKGLLNAVTYAGMISSAFIWGFLCDTLGRKKLLTIGLLLDGLFLMMAALSQNFQLLMIAKFLGGFIINGPFAALTAYLSEFHCAKQRARVQMILGAIFSLGNLILPLLALIILPFNIKLKLGSLEFHSWNIYLMVSSLPAIASGVAFIFLPESPKFLMTIGDNKKALQVFKKVYHVNTGYPEETYPIKYLVDEVNNFDINLTPNDVTTIKTNKQMLKEGFHQIKPIFLPPHVTKIVLVFLLQFMIMMGLNTLRLWLPQIYQAMNDYQYYNNKSATLCETLEIFQPKTEIFNTTVSTCQINSNNTEVYTNSMIVATTSIIGYITAGTLINSLGKKTLLGILGFISGSMAMMLYFSENVASTIAFSAMFVTFGSIGINVILAVVVDLTPTSLRAMAVSLTMMFGRFGAAIGNLIFPYLLESGCAPPFFSVGSVMIGCAFLAYFLPNTDMKALL
ncbi:synaptic vesicle glycoprotein 2B-like isoform X2 [Diorhabda carinulata]|uniref:synaptic vesicle glycoprotein 2B-like isoform X2 n=1 Tax=Diorhabda carinulata TaxID=1163345 RepID=UPI0025A16438|nr:synaptic vesicle glycoprotein 2B-like isoform X2 [Diorhabda carinulata]